MSDFGIYVHWPFCARKCPYCDFNSHVRSRIDESEWARLVISELQAVARLDPHHSSVGSIFFGGGTPSLMSEGAVGSVLTAIDRLWPLTSNVEITLEANPNSVEQKRFAGYRSAGVNRLSIGVQSFDDTALLQLGRLHGAAEARSSVELALGVFSRVSFDLIYARPEQSLTAWDAELSDALSLGTEHLSLYQLTIENGTAFATLHRQGRLSLPNEELAADLYSLTQEKCSAAGLGGYEISNHARPGRESRHNLLYWRYGDYAGVGPGAHGRLTFGRQRVATECERLPERWAARVNSEGQGFSVTELSDREAAREHLLMSLRLAEGVSLTALAARWGVAPAPERIAHLEQLDLIWKREGRIATTPAGRLVLNRVTSQLADSFATWV